MKCMKFMRFMGFIVSSIGMCWLWLGCFFINCLVRYEMVLVSAGYHIMVKMFQRLTFFTVSIGTYPY